jgi:hypothetical protein
MDQTFLSEVSKKSHCFSGMEMSEIFSGMNQTDPALF